MAKEIDWPLGCFGSFIDNAIEAYYFRPVSMIAPEQKLDINIEVKDLNNGIASSGDQMQENYISDDS